MEFSGRREVIKSLWKSCEQPECSEKYGLELGGDCLDNAAAQPLSKIDVKSIINKIYISGSGTF